MLNRPFTTAVCSITRTIYHRHHCKAPLLLALAAPSHSPFSLPLLPCLNLPHLSSSPPHLLHAPHVKLHFAAPSSISIPPTLAPPSIPSCPSPPSNFPACPPQHLPFPAPSATAQFSCCPANWVPGNSWQHHSFPHHSFLHLSIPLHSFAIAFPLPPILLLHFPYLITILILLSLIILPLILLRILLPLILLYLHYFPLQLLPTLFQPTIPTPPPPSHVRSHPLRPSCLPHFPFPFVLPRPASPAKHLAPPVSHPHLSAPLSTPSAALPPHPSPPHPLSRRMAAALLSLHCSVPAPPPAALSAALFPLAAHITASSCAASPTAAPKAAFPPSSRRSN
ncbi:unnamed protein product [Closterium sp. Naga37s-1]|nr:unnamed protein product [Closterium sp. Naga37s-1]